MAVHESQIDAVSRVYAQSLFDLANETGSQAKIEEVADEQIGSLQVGKLNVFPDALGF